MIECVFTIDYEIYGNGDGDLGELVLDPTARLMSVFDRWDASFVAFVEAAEFEKIEAAGTDHSSGAVRRQIKAMHQRGFEVALHLHPQWCNARFENGRWMLDYTEYNLCTLPQERISQIVGQSIRYLREVLGDPRFTPASFRAGNWLFQPSGRAAAVLYEHGIRVDSSVFKGGVQRFHGLDYRRALKNGFFWRFGKEVDTADPGGRLLEIPIYARMVPFWKMLTNKRIGLQRKSPSGGRSPRQQVCRLLDRLRFKHPLKFDFCRMTLDEMKAMVSCVIVEDRQSPHLFKPLVAIGHSKDLVDLDAVDAFLAYLRSENIPVSTLKGVCGKCERSF